MTFYYCKPKGLDRSVRDSGRSVDSGCYREGCDKPNEARRNQFTTPDSARLLLRRIITVESVCRISNKQVARIDLPQLHRTTSLQPQRSGY